MSVITETELNKRKEWIEDKVQELEYNIKKIIERVNEIEIRIER